MKKTFGVHDLLGGVAARRMFVGGMLAALALPVAGAMAVSETDDWPIRLTFTEDGRKDRRVLVAENVADFVCTKLRLQMTIVGGTLKHGSGQSSARLENGVLVFGEVAALSPKEIIRWTVDFEPSQDSAAATITANLDFAEKPEVAQKKAAAEKPAEKLGVTEVKPAPKRGCSDFSPAVGRDKNVAELAFPTGSRATSALLVHQVMPAEVEKGKPYTYEYHVTNLSSGVLQNVELQASGFRNLAAVKSEPPGETRADVIRWVIGDLGECETRVITVTASSGEIGMASACLAATFSNRLCASTKVVEPALKITKTATPEVTTCELINIKLVVSNPGSGSTRNVQVSDDLPDGLKTTDGKTRFTSAVGDLAPGASKEIAFQAKADKTGKFMNTAVATADGGMKASSETTTTVVRQPALQIACTAPEERFIGRTANYCFEVKNSGDAPANDTVVKVAVPGGVEVTGLTKGGAAGKGELTWNLGSLPAGGTQKVCFDMKSGQAATLQASATATATCASPAKTSCQTRVIGIPAILLEVVDIEDPIEVGGQTTYVITVTNQGSSAGTNIKVACDLSDLSGYVSSSGASPSTAAGKRVTFAPIPSLAPKQKVEWRLVVSAKAEGDARLAIEMTSDQFAQPVRETESTNHYK